MRRREVARAGRKSRPPHLRVAQAQIAASSGGLLLRGRTAPCAPSAPFQCVSWPGRKIRLTQSLSKRSDVELREARPPPCKERHARPRAAGFAFGGTTGVPWCASAPPCQGPDGDRYLGRARGAAGRSSARRRCCVPGGGSWGGRLVRGSRAHRLLKGPGSFRPSVGEIWGARASVASLRSPLWHLYGTRSPARIRPA